MVLFGLNNQLLNKFWSFFGLTRGADLIVYISIIVLFYFFIDLYNRMTKDKYHLTQLVTQAAIDTAITCFLSTIKSYKNTKPEDDFIFFIRAYNEAQTIWLVVDDIIKAGYTKIMIINDGSQDQTAQIIEQKIQQYNEALIIHIKHPINRWDKWAGAATKTWYRFLQQYWDILNIKRVVGFDADRQMDIEDMHVFRKYMDKQPADIYVWSRFVHGGSATNMPKFRRIILQISRFVIRLFYGSKLTDPHNGYRIISLNVAQKIHLLSDGMHYANELNDQFKKHKCHYIEVPVHINYTDYSLSKWQKNGNSIRLALEMIYKKLFFR